MHRAVFALVFLTALGVSAAFPVFDLRPLRQKLASPVLSRRRLLQSGLCAWDAEASVCQGSGAAGIPILTASDSSIAQFLATQFVRDSVLFALVDASLFAAMFDGDRSGCVRRRWILFLGSVRDLAVLSWW